jgi:hypothetical protein
MWKYHKILGITLLSLAMASQTIAAAPGSPNFTPRKASKLTLSQLAKNLKAGFYEIPDTRIADVFPSSAQLKDGWGVLGPRAVIMAWNGAGFDPDKLEWYFHGGGHTDYGGNEVYRFSFTSLRWQRLTLPAPYPKRNPDKSSPLAERCPYPLSGPPSTHTYDGTFFSSATGTLFVFGDIAYCPSSQGLRWGNGADEFNPSESESRNGLSPLSWRWRPEISAPKGLKHTAVLADGNVLIGGGESDALLDPRSGQVSASNGNAGNAGPGTSLYDHRRNTIWLLNNAGLSRIDYTNNNLSSRQKIVSAPCPYGINGSSGIALHVPSGKLVFWNGGNQIVTFDPDHEKWQKFDFSSNGPKQDGSESSYIYSKWIYLPEFDLFAGYNDPRQGIKLFKFAP